MAGLRKYYGETVAVDGCDLVVDRGQILGFVGPNGAGKTTTMRAILGVVGIDGGSISWDGQPIGFEHRQRTGYLPQERGLYQRMKVHAHVAYMGRLAGLERAVAAERAGRWLERVGLANQHETLVQELSVGNQQRVQLAVALVHEPELLVLDEPFAGLDPLGVKAMQSILVERAEAGVAVVFSSHQLDLVQDLCRDVVIIAAGQNVAAGSVHDLRAQSNIRRVQARWEHPVPADQARTAIAPYDGAAILEPGTGSVAAVDLTLDATAVAADVLAALASVGPIADFSFSPPGLEQVFFELVHADEAAA